jgi:adenylate cyclase
LGFDDVADTDDDAPSRLAEFDASEPTASMTSTVTGMDSAPESAHDTDQADRPPPTVLGESKRIIAASALFDCPIHLRDEALDLVENIAYKLDGLIHARREDELVILFGLPVAHENDIVSAVRFAFDAQEAVSMFVDDAVGSESNGKALPPSVRFGLRAGTARLSSLPSEEGYQLIGTALADAHTLAAQAEPAEIRVTGSATRLAAPHYLLREVPALAGEGKKHRCHQIVGPRTGAREPPAGQIDVLIGREIETKAMRSAWRDAVTRGEQRTLLITGSVGVGKTRLVDDFLAYHCSESLIVAAAATPHRADTPYAVVADLLRGIADHSSRQRPHSRSRLLAAIAEILRANTSDGADILEAFKLVVDPGAAPRVESWIEVARTRVYRGVRALLERVAGRRPLVMVIEDLHWADSASREIVRTLVESPSHATGPLLLLITLREEEGIEAEALLPDTHASLIHLNEFDEGARQRLIVNLLGELGTDRLVAEIERRAGGSPLFIHELCRAIREIGESEPVEIPETVHDVIASRVDGLPAPLKVVLQHAAVIGPSFRESILARLIARNPARPLAELRNRGFLAPTVNITVPYHSTAGVSDKFERQWGFRHVVVQEVIYRSLDAADRDDVRQGTAPRPWRRRGPAIRRGAWTRTDLRSPRPAQEAGRRPGGAAAARRGRFSPPGRSAHPRGRPPAAPRGVLSRPRSRRGGRRGGRDRG